MQAISTRGGILLGTRVDLAGKVPWAGATVELAHNGLAGWTTGKICSRTPSNPRPVGIRGMPPLTSVAALRVRIVARHKNNNQRCKLLLASILQKRAIFACFWPLQESNQGGPKGVQPTFYTHHRWQESPGHVLLAPQEKMKVSCGLAEPTDHGKLPSSSVHVAYLMMTGTGILHTQKGEGHLSSMMNGTFTALQNIEAHAFRPVQYHLVVDLPRMVALAIICQQPLVQRHVHNGQALARRIHLHTIYNMDTNLLQLHRKLSSLATGPGRLYLWKVRPGPASEKIRCVCVITASSLSAHKQL